MRSLFLALLIAIFPVGALATTATTCSQSDVASAISATSAGGTVNVPAGSCTWTTGVSFSGITLSGAGSGRIIAYDSGSATPTIGTGTKTFTVAGYSPGFSSSSITNGETLRVFETNTVGNYMQGTVTSLSGGTLTMNITSTGGSGSTHRWLISTLPTTIITDNTSSGLMTMTESTSQHTTLTGIQIVQGTDASPSIPFIFTSGGEPMLVHDNWFEMLSNAEMIDSTTNRGVIWNNTVNGSTGNNNQLTTTAVLRIKGAPNAWTSASTWGAADTTGTNAIYFETNDVHVMQSASDNDDNGKMVWRYNLMDHSTFGTHGADTSNYGERYFEYYENTGVFYGYSDGSTFNMANGWVGLIRGGTFVMWGNTLPAIVSTDYGTKADALMIDMNLQRNAGPNPCWGAGGSAGQYYPTPRQVGFGRVTGSGTANFPTDGVTSSSTDSITYVGDIEPAYMWGNSREPLDNVIVEDYGITNTNGCPSSPTPDSSAHYIESGRDYFNSSTAKPSYTAYTYPHPLASGGGGTTVATPVLSPATENFSNTVSVSITCSTSASTIYYTTDGSTPTTGSTTYSTAITVSSTTTIKAIAAASGDTNSAVASETYTLSSLPAMQGAGASNGSFR